MFAVKLVRKTLKEKCLINRRKYLSSLNVFTINYTEQLNYRSIKLCTNSTEKICLNIMCFRRFLLAVLFKKVIKLNCIETLDYEL